MKTSTLFLISYITFSIFFLGCGNGHTNSSSDAPNLGTPVSIVTTEENATMRPSPSTLKSITYKIASIIQNDINTQNEKEATIFTKETQYCDISGIKESSNAGSFSKITKTENFHQCKSAKRLQHGQLKINYQKMNSEGKFPKLLDLTILNDYSVNDLLLKKGTTINTKVTYDKTQHIKTIQLSITGVVTYQYGVYFLKVSNKIIEF
jgi:hypothetical protein